MRHVTPFSGRLAVAVGVLGALAVGVGAGHLGVPIGVAGALAFGWGTGALTAETNGRRAAGSIAVVLGGIVALAGVGVLYGRGLLTGVLAVLAVGAVTVDATAGLDDDSLAPVLASLGSSIATLIGGVALTSLLHVAFSVGVAWLLLAGIAKLTLMTSLGAFVVLQLLAVVVAGLVGPSRAVVEEWFQGDVPITAWEDLEALELSPWSVPKAFWAVLGLQLLLAFTPWGHVLVNWLLESTFLFGDAAKAVLQSGLLHGALFLVLLLELAVLGGDAVRGTAVAMLSPNPPKSLSYAAGGVALVLVVPVAVFLAGILGVAGVLPLGDPSWGVAAAVLSVAVVTLGGVFALEIAGVILAERTPLPPYTGGFALGGGLLFLASVAAAAAGAPALAVFVGVAAALVSWDLGETAVDVGSHLGPSVETRRAEAVHATGSVAVGVVGVLAAAAGLHLLGPIPVPGGSGRAALALTLALVALVAFALALDGSSAGE